MGHIHYLISHQTLKLNLGKRLAILFMPYVHVEFEMNHNTPQHIRFKITPTDQPHNGHPNATYGAFGQENEPE